MSLGNSNCGDNEMALRESTNECCTTSENWT